MERILTNSAFSFPKQHPFMKLVLENVVGNYDPLVWAGIGPGMTNYNKILNIKGLFRGA